MASLKKGDKVTCSAQRDWYGTHLAPCVRKDTYTVIQVGGKGLSDDRIVIGKNGVVTAAVHIKYLTPVKPKKNKLVSKKPVKRKKTTPVSQDLKEDNKITLKPINMLIALAKALAALIGKNGNISTADGKDSASASDDDLQKLLEASLFDDEYNQIADSWLEQRFSDEELAAIEEADTFDDIYNQFGDSWLENRFTKKELKAIKKADLINDPYNKRAWSWLYNPTEENQKIKKDLLEAGTYDDDYNKMGYVNGKLVSVGSNRLPRITEGMIRNIASNDPNVVQNAYKYPVKVSSTKKYVHGKKKEVYTYDYKTQDFTSYSGDDETLNKISSTIDAIDKSNNTDIKSRNKILEYQTNYYNRFKINTSNNQLSKTFAHVFFVRPDCNIFESNNGGHSAEPKLAKTLKTHPEFYYALKHRPETLRQLTQMDSGYDDEFMMLLSNTAKSFELSDEYVVSDTYGTALTGYKVAYGKDNVESKTAGKFSINYIDDRDLNIYQTHKLWIDYISDVYRGKVLPRKSYIKQKIIDYATCVYYILCAEDGETILFWSKYWGVFPLEAPSSGFSYSAENIGGVKNPELKIEYQYSWKEDFNPLSLIEFNMHTSKEAKKNYLKAYWQEGDSNSTKLHFTPYTWTGAPFIETVNQINPTSSDGRVIPYTFKLRFGKR